MLLYWNDAEEYLYKKWQKHNPEIQKYSEKQPEAQVLVHAWTKLTKIHLISNHFLLLTLFLFLNHLYFSYDLIRSMQMCCLKNPSIMHAQLHKNQRRRLFSIVSFGIWSSGLWYSYMENWILFLHITYLGYSPAEVSYFFPYIFYEKANICTAFWKVCICYS